jgi:5-methylcytosine-specific restriction endonuclease McrA
MPIDYSKYPANWKTEIRPAILKRAGNRCEFCGVQNGATVYRQKNSRGRGQLSSYSVKIVLTVAHLNHDITDNRPENLRALCQSCHLTHDKEQHAQTRRRNRRARDLTPDLL